MLIHYFDVREQKKTSKTIDQSFYHNYTIISYQFSEIRANFTNDYHRLIV